jgi:hypothetical protein
VEGARRGRPREEVEWMRRVSLMTCWRLGGWVSVCDAKGGDEDVLGEVLDHIIVWDPRTSG